MDSRDAIRPILAGLIGIGLIVLVIVLIIKAFAGGGTSAPTNQIDITKYASTPNSSVTLLIDAPTRVNQDHRQVKITVSASGNEMDVIQGYEGSVMTTQSYANNSAAYATFLQTLKLMNFSKGRTSSADYRGYCPTGDRYIFTFYNGENNLFTYWTTSCGSQGTYEGQLNQVLQQFQRQIPDTDFNRLTRNIPIFSS